MYLIFLHDAIYQSGTLFETIASSNSGDNIRQSGGFDFKVASLYNDTELFNQAFETAKAIISEDPDLSLPEHQLINEELKRLLTTDYSTIS